jgi:predicted transcriptional regulator
MARSSVLSPIRQQIYDFIVQFKAEHDGNSPSIREMAEKFERSTNTINYDLSYLDAMGLIERGEKGESRMIKVVGAKWIAPDPELAKQASPQISVREEQRSSGIFTGNE